jgi:hypothetical protein
MTEVDEIKSPFLRKAIEQRGIGDDQVTSLMIVERYLRHPELQDSIVALMLKEIDRDLPLEAAIVRRETELGRSLTELEMKMLRVDAPKPAALARSEPIPTAAVVAAG